MKKVTLAREGETIKFLVRGQRHSNNAVEVEIDTKGVMCRDDDAALIKERLGSQVRVTDVSAEEAAKMAQKAAGNTGGNTPQISEAAETLAKENGIDPSSITGTGANGNITKKDVEDAIANK